MIILIGKCLGSWTSITRTLFNWPEGYTTSYRSNYFSPVITTSNNTEAWLSKRIIHPSAHPQSYKLRLAFYFTTGFMKHRASLLAQCLQCRRPGFNPWVGKILWRRERLPTPVFWPGEFHGLYSAWGHKESDTIEWLTFHEAQGAMICKTCHNYSRMELNWGSLWHLLYGEKWKSTLALFPYFTPFLAPAK